MQVLVTFTMQCGIPGCPTTATQEFRVPFDGVMPRPVEPLGWFRLCDLWVCPEHRISVMVDEQDLSVDYLLPF